MRAGYKINTRFGGHTKKDMSLGRESANPMPDRAYKGIPYSRESDKQLFRIHNRKKGCPGWKQEWATYFKKEQDLMRFVDQTILPSLSEEVVEKMQSEYVSVSCPVCYAKYLPLYIYYGACPMCNN